MLTRKYLQVQRTMFNVNRSSFLYCLDKEGLIYIVVQINLLKVCVMPFVRPGILDRPVNMPVIISP